MVVATPAAALVANPAAAGSRPILVAPGRIGLYPLHADGSCKHFSMWSSWRVRGWPLQRHSVSRERDKTRFVKSCSRIARQRISRHLKDRMVGLSRCVLEARLDIFSF
jgi:hypothetical protein